MLFVLLSFVILVTLTLYLRRVYTRFNKYGVKSFKPILVLGNVGRIVFRLEHFAENLEKLYHAFPQERFIGRYEFTNPIIMLKDIELIKSVTVKDYECFLDHRVSVDENIDPFFGRNLLSLKGQEWKDMRSTLSPAFTSSKIRLMVPFMVAVGDLMIRSLKKKIQCSEDFIEVDCKDLTTRYANDVIASCAFGLNVDSQTDRNNAFYTMGKAAATFKLSRLFKLLALNAWPTVSKVLRISLFTQSTKDFFYNLVLNTMHEREAKRIIRPDMIHLLMEAKRGELKHDEKDVEESDAGYATVEEFSVNKKNSDRVWSDSHLVAQAMLFIIAGFDTVSTAMSFALHELALHPDIQERLYNEIKEQETRNGGIFDYNSIQNMKYLDMVVSEVLRLWPPVISFDRLCVKDYNLGKPNEGSSQDYIIRKGESVIIPLWAIHRDPAVYPDPDKFDPERFSEKNKHLIRPFTYIPFGLGPRNCIGSRFALCEIKVLLYQLLLHMQLSPSARTCTPEKLLPGMFIISLKGGHWLRLQPRN